MEGAVIRPTEERESVRLFFPYAALPRDNERIGAMVRGRLILSKVYRQKKEALSLLARAQYRGNPITGAVSVVGSATWPDKRKRDLSFFMKGLHDALEGVVYEDDAQIEHLSYSISREGEPGVSVIIVSLA